MVQRLTDTASLEKTEVTAFFGEILRRGLSLRVKVTGKSMAPFLKGGEVVIVKKVPCLDLRIGDLIFFENPDGFPILHRIVRKRRSTGDDVTIQTRGDALMSFDEEIRGGSVLGKVVRIERPAQSGKTTHIDMDSLFYRCMNFSIAARGFFKTQTYFLLSGVVLKKSVRNSFSKKTGSG